MASRKKRKNSRGSNAGCLVLLVGFIVLFVVFIVKLPDIKTTLDKTKFLDILKQRASTSSTAKPDTSSTSTTVRMIAVPGSGGRSSTTLAPAAPAAPQEIPPATDRKVAVTSSTEPAPAPAPQPAKPGAGQGAGAGVAAPGAAPANTTASTQAPAARARQASLFFVKIEDDGMISRHEVKRNVPASDSPLADAVRALISGPSEAEIRSGLVSLIPRGTRLLGITVRGSTAIIDLSDAFMYNHYGPEGYSAQLKQIIYTATSFPSVQDVQVLIEGKQKEYLGGEGVYIGKPLSRNSF